jgi:organic hydroperoxide reductase OsmC/OhrA
MIVGVDNHVHRYAATCSWRGSTGDGYEAYSRAHDAGCPPVRTSIRLSGDSAFRGDPALMNPEQLLVVAASSCQLLSFLAVSARARVDVIAYDDDASGEMPEGRYPWVEKIVLRPHVVYRGDTPESRVRHLLDLAHRECFIANSLRTVITLEPRLERTDQ